MPAIFSFSPEFALIRNTFSVMNISFPYLCSATNNIVILCKYKPLKRTVSKEIFVNIRVNFFGEEISSPDDSICRSYQCVINLPTIFNQFTDKSCFLFRQNSVLLTCFTEVRTGMVEKGAGRY